MACSCRTKRNIEQTIEQTDSSGKVIQVTTTVPVYTDMIPHEVLPGESCIFCAGKHVSTAYTLLQTGSSMAAVIGELELARRHTIAEFQTVSGAIAEIEFLACMRRPADVFSRIRGVLAAIDAEAAKHDPNSSESSDRIVVSTPASMSTNPLLGELHAYAAWRLVTEVGYYLSNRSMVIGDLAMTSQYMHDINIDIDSRTRALRHRLESLMEADMDIDWPEFALWVEYNVDKKITEYREKYQAGLRDYLGLATQP